MQDLHAVVGGRMFDAAAVDRRLRPLSHHHALKCPRCDSLNTKFCYYNNYNLSQPRHFCKGCRRYWTNGGVLRNVPVGGGCRKNKRSKVKISPTKTAADEVATTTTVTSQQIDRKSSSHSSSESSGGYTAAAEAVCGSTSAGLLYTQLEYESLAAKSNSGGACFGHGDGAFTDIGGLMAAAASEPIPGGFNFSNRALMSQQSQDTCQQNQWQQQDQIPGTFLDQTVQVDFAALQSGFGPLDWQPCKDQGGVDLASGTVDQAYWCQSQIQWTDNDHPGLYLP